MRKFVSTVTVPAACTVMFTTDEVAVRPPASVAMARRAYAPVATPLQSKVKGLLTSVPSSTLLV